MSPREPIPAPLQHRAVAGCPWCPLRQRGECHPREEVEDPSDCQVGRQNSASPQLLCRGRSPLYHLQGNGNRKRAGAAPVDMHVKGPHEPHGPEYSRVHATWDQRPDAGAGVLREQVQVKPTRE